MTAPQDNPNHASLVLRNTRIMWFAFLAWACGIIVLAYVMHKPATHPAPSPDLSWALAAVGTVEIAFFAFLRRTLFRKSRNQVQRGETADALRTWTLPQVPGQASAMSIVLFGFVLHVLGARPPWVSAAFFVAGLINLAVYRPQPTE